MREWDIGPDVDGLKLDRGGIVGCAIGGEGRDILETLGSNEAEYGCAYDTVFTILIN